MHESIEAAVAASASSTPARQLPINFTGSGSEYFRIWIVNLLLCLLTLGLYLPFAKARRLRYFYANTRIDGQALSFHGNPWHMFRGFMLLLLLMGAYALAGRYSPMAGLVAFGVLCAVWPALWRASLQFRLGNTSWRGLRMGFRGELASAYKAVLPVYLPSIIMLLAQAAFGPGAQEQAGDQALWLGIGTGLPLLAMLLLLPLGLARIKRYQHDAYVYANQRSQLSTPTRRFYGLSLKGMSVTLLPMFLIGMLSAVLIPALQSKPEAKAVVFGLLGLLLILAYLLMFMIAGPYFTARMQNLVWSGTSSAHLQFDSHLKFRALAWLTAKNWLLTLLTLGLYRPFAAINTARLRLAAMGLALSGDLDDWVADRMVADADAAGEAAGDFFGFDMGL
ncbi:YjgN family protein [Roseateles oligotrophus]|uniref:DUF898 domain-containing protein n=1 Tax=Roseateles oligotrophus TaxID=1769250 RepID=A0ABT2YJQ3_9BURK|nr:YjgN family protein [Roseateles oligotrophus]MCV2370295.1 DUF898 domain-containing protein [Roseateles oligotrophus]